MIILITGATGNVGKYLVNKLHASNYELFFFTTSFNKLNFFGLKPKDIIGILQKISSI